MKNHSLATLSPVDIAHARLQYYGRIAVMDAWEQMVRNGSAARLEASDARSAARKRCQKRLSGRQDKVSDLREFRTAENRKRVRQYATDVGHDLGTAGSGNDRRPQSNRGVQSLRRKSGPRVPVDGGPDRYGQRLFDEAKHPRAPAGRANGGQFIEARGPATSSDTTSSKAVAAPSSHGDRTVGPPKNVAIKKLKPLPRLIPESTPVASRLDSEWQGTGVFWDVDGRPWELSKRDIRDWKAITERGWWAEGWNSVAPSFWTSIPEFEAEIKRKARSYRDRLLLHEGSPNPIDVFKRRNERAQAALQADAGELYTTLDNATSLAGFAKVPLKAGFKAVAKSATGRNAVMKSKLFGRPGNTNPLLDLEGEEKGRSPILQDAIRSLE